MRPLSVIATAVATIVVSGVVVSQAQSPNERDAARGVVKKQADAVVTVTATVKLRVNVGGRDQPRDQPAQANATVLDSTGLAVTSLSTLVPDALYERGLTMQMPSGTKIEVSSEVSDMKIRTADGREVAARLVLKDDDLDLAFIRPTEAVSPAMPFVDAATVRPSLLDLLVLVQRTNESTGWATSTAFGTVQLIIDKPRTYYLVAFP
jgi:S1-C subfamily serine protease